MNLFDMMRAAGGGDAFAELARQYGLTQEQVGKAVEALMPGFSAGLKRSATDPFGLMQLLQSMARRDYARAYRSPAWASSNGRPEGEEALSLLLGSQEVAQKSAELAAAYTGLAQETLRQLQAPLAAMMLGGLAEQSSAHNPMLDAMLKSTRAAANNEEPKGKGPLDRYEEEQEERERAAAADMARAFDQSMQAGLAALQAGGAAWQKAMAAMLEGQRGETSGGGEREAGETPAHTLFGDLLEPGVRLSEAYQRQVADMLQQLSPSGKGRGNKGAQ
jgi:hypothetical protein